MRMQLPSAWLKQWYQGCWQEVPSAGQPCSALCHCQHSIFLVPESGSRPSPVLVAALPITQGRLHRMSPRNANCFGLCLVQQSHWALRALSQLRDLPDPSSPSPGELVEFCCGRCDPHIPGSQLSCRLAPKLAQRSQIHRGTRQDVLSSGHCIPRVKHPKLSPQQVQCRVRCTPPAGGRVAGGAVAVLYPVGCCWCCSVLPDPSLVLPTPALP